ncbi:single-stranded-DNA-specific exonuclease RecJ [Candidatus Azambacteria bacterium]|nr:single-stranded-DNA-specific exonuclease RecJ [Candidatus Azambacteria bacterium]
MMESSHALLASGPPLAFLPQNGQGKRWQVFSPAPELFTDSFPEYPKVALQLLYNRGLRTQKEVDEFFNPDYPADVHDPYLFIDMEKAVARISRAIEKKEKIIVYGDYDADGVCGSVVLHTALTALGADVEVYIPDRFQEGYGLNEKALAEIVKDKKVGVIVTVDCGVTDVKEVAFLNKKGIDVIIVDHHLVPPEAPACFAMLNPKREGETYPFKYLCATGVAFKFASALLKTDKAIQAGVKEGFEKWLLDIVAIGSVADMVPLLGENRTFVKYGLIVVKKTRRLGLKELLRFQPARMNGNGFSAEKGQITAETIAFMIAPRINAASRMAHATASFELLIATDEASATTLADTLEDLNNDRRKSVDRIMKEAAEKLEDEPVLFLGDKEWPVGVVGLVSGRLTEKYGKPSFVYGGVNGYYRGSCRGINGFNVVDVMRACDEKEGGLLTEYGGHPMAGGFSVAP